MLHYFCLGDVTLNYMKNKLAIKCSSRADRQFGTKTLQRQDISVLRLGHFSPRAWTLLS